MIYATPRMELYLTLSSDVVSIFLDFVSEEDLHVYSVDESFLDLTPYLRLYQSSPEGIVQRIQKRIRDELGLVATSGIGPNPFLAKVALDVEGKKKPPYIAHWTYDDVPTKLWEIEPIDEIWGIATGTKNHLARIGIRSLRELAAADVSFLKKEFGVLGEQLHELANGRDGSIIAEKYVPADVSFSYGQTLRRPYKKEAGRLILRESVDELCKRLRRHETLSAHVGLCVMYQGYGPYSKGRSLSVPLDDVDALFAEILHLYEDAPNLPIIGFSLSFGKLSQSGTRQLSLFLDEKKRVEEENLAISLDAIGALYGPNAVLRTSALLPESTIKERHTQIGGHRR